METNENIELKRMIDILMNKKLIIVLILIVSTMVGYIYTYKYTTPKYQSTSTLLLTPNSNSGKNTITTSDLTLNSELISTYSDIAKKPKVLKQVIENLNLNMTEEQLANQIQVKAVSDTYIMEIAVQDVNARKAMLITRELANVLVKEIKQIYNLDNIEIIDEAQTAKSPYNINHIKDIMMFFVIGGFIAGFYVMLIYMFDNTIKREEEIEKYIKIKNLGIIPIHANRKQEIVDRSNAKSYITECLNTIRTNILYMNSTKKGKTILITSCTPSEGKSWVSSNVAVTFAQTNKRVLLIDCDMRKGRLNKIFGTNNKEGLSNYLYNMTGNTKKDMQLAKKYIKETKISNMHILTNGTIPPNPSELVGSDNMKKLVAILEQVYDIIIIDAPPCKLVTDSIILSTIVTSTILVINSTKTKINDLLEVKKSIQAVGGKIIGAVLNKVKIKAKDYNSNYYYGSELKKGHKKIVEQENITVEEIVKEATQKLKQKEKQKKEKMKKAELLKNIESMTSGNTPLDNKELSKIVKQLEQIQENYEKSLLIMNKKQNTQEQTQLLLNMKMLQMKEDMDKLSNQYLGLSDDEKTTNKKKRKNNGDNIVDIKDSIA